MTSFVRLERKSRRWVQVWQGDSEAVASIVAGRLQAEGIATRVQGHTAPYRTTALAVGGAWGILVPAGKAPLAREVLRRNDEARNLIDDEPSGGLTANQRRTIRFMILAACVIAFAVILLEVTR